MRLSPAERDAAVEVLAGRWPDRVAATELARFWEVVSFLRIEGMALTALDTREGGAEGYDPPVSVRDRALRAGLHATLHLEVATTALELMRGIGVSGVMFKGTELLAAGVYTDPSQRRMDDADLLIPVEGAESALNALFAAGFAPWSTWHAGSEGWLDTASLFAPGTNSRLPLHLDLHWRLGRGELHFGAGGREAALLDGALGGHPHPDGHFVHVVEHLLRHLRVRPHPPGIADVLRSADRIDDPQRVGALLLEGPLAPAALGLIVASVPVVSSEAGRARLESVADHMRRQRPGLRGSGPEKLADLLAGDLSARRGRLSGARLRWTQSGGGVDGLLDLARGLKPRDKWLCERYPDTSLQRARLRYLTDVGLWLAGGPSPASPNQSKSAVIGR